MSPIAFPVGQYTLARSLEAGKGFDFKGFEDAMSGVGMKEGRERGM